MRRNRPIAWWMGCALVAEAALAALALGVFGAAEHGTIIALQVTARLSFLLFLAAYVGGAASQVFGPPAQFLRRHGRTFGLAFASAHLVHVGLIVWLCWIGSTPSRATFVFFGIALFWTYLLALLSFARLRHALGHRGWMLVRTIGMNYIAYAFAVDFLAHHPSASLKYLVFSLPFAALSIVGPALYWIAVLRSVARFWQSHVLGRAAQAVGTAAPGIGNGIPDAQGTMR